MLGDMSGILVFANHFLPCGLPGEHGVSFCCFDILHPMKSKVELQRSINKSRNATGVKCRQEKHKQCWFCRKRSQPFYHSERPGPRREPSLLGLAALLSRWQPQKQRCWNQDDVGGRMREEGGCWRWGREGESARKMKRLELRTP